VTRVFNPLPPGSRSRPASSSFESPVTRPRDANALWGFHPLPQKPEEGFCLQFCIARLFGAVRLGAEFAGDRGASACVGCRVIAIPSSFAGPITPGVPVSIAELMAAALPAESASELVQGKPRQANRAFSQTRSSRRILMTGKKAQGKEREPPLETGSSLSGKSASHVRLPGSCVRRYAIGRIAAAVVSTGGS